MARKVSYMSLLKEAINDVTDTSKAADEKGPMLDPILGFKGDGELKTYTDAAGILERYYYGEEETQDVVIEDTPAPPEEKFRGEENEIKTGDDPDSVETTKKDIEAELTEALMREMDEEEAEDEVEEAEEEEKEEKEEEKEPVKEDAEVIEEDTDLDDSELFAEGVENEVIEKLIMEMEGELEDLEEAFDEEVDGEPVSEAPGTLPSQPDSMKAEEDLIEEAFKIFQEEIMDDEDPTDDENEYTETDKVEDEAKKDKHTPEV